MQQTQLARHNMVDGQLAPNQVSEPRVVAALGVAPREKFVPESLRACAYTDEDLPLGHGRYLMQPVTLGRLLQAASVQEGESAMVVAGSTGYSAVVLAHLGCRVVMVEEERELADAARLLLSELGMNQIKIQMAGLQMGCKTDAPFDVILIDGAVETIPASLKKQLAEGGRLLCVERMPTQDAPLVAGMGQAVVWTRQSDVWLKTVVCDAAVPVIPSFKKEIGFTF